MGELGTITAEQIAYSYAHWWREAGLDCATDEAPRRWRDGETVPFWRQQREAQQESHQSAPPRQAQPNLQARTAPIPQTRAPQPTPDTLPAFVDWIAQDSDQPEADWHGPLIPLPLLEKPQLLLIIDMPPAHAQDVEGLLDDDQRRFVSAVVSALGLSPGEAPCISLTMRAAPGGLLDDQALSHLGTRMRRYLGFVKPGAVIVLGDRASRALLGDRWRPGAKSLEHVVLPHGGVDIVPLAGLDLLMSRPAAKAKSWQLLRSLHGRLNQ
jgi:hypothetical protein